MQGNNEIASVTFMSYNPTGLDSSMKCRFTNSICEDLDVDFLSIQEHMKSISSTDQYFKKEIPNYYQFVIPAHKRLVEQRLG